MTDHYLVPIVALGGVLFLVFLFFIIFYMLYHTKRVRIHESEKERLQYEHNLQLLSTRLEEQERTLTQISKELHDNISQKVDFLQMNMKAIKEGSAGPEAIDNGVSIADQISGDLRNLSYSLNSDYVRIHGLKSVLRNELGYISSAQGIDCRLIAEDYKATLEPEKELLVYRIAQEALHNAAKHAKATSITVTLSHQEGSFLMEVTDNGKGFDPSTPDTKEGLGFTNMHQRTKLLGGNLELLSQPGKGTKVRLQA